jgi:hypothetical protein
LGRRDDAASGAEAQERVGVETHRVRSPFSIP